MNNQIKTGEVFVGDGIELPLRGDRLGAQVVSQLQARYAEAVKRGRVFSAMSQAAQAITVALATTYTGLALSNPIGNNKRLIPLQVGLALSVAPAAIAPIGLIGNRAAVDVVHTAALTPICTQIGNAALPSGKVDNQATIPTPVWLAALWSGFTAAALPASSPQLIDLGGILVIEPGGFVAIGALTAVTGLWSISWMEEPV